MQIKSKERVKSLAEVYTNEREVNAMLDLIPMSSSDSIISYKYLEPACGNGNFLIEILRRKLKRINEKYDEGSLLKYEFYVARALSTIYGIDICPENVEESKNRLFTEVKANFDTHRGSFIYSDGYLALIKHILDANIVVGDAINAADKIKFTEFKIDGFKLKERVFVFSDLVNSDPTPIAESAFSYFLDIGKKYEKH